MASSLKRRAPKASLKRPVGSRTPRKTITAWCEGSKSEPEYLEALRALPEVRSVAAVDIRIEDVRNGAVPLTLVEHAVAARKRARRERGEIDEFWCLFDVEWPKHHPNLTQALQLAASNSINVAISNPCFEVWLVLHFASCAKPLSNAEARRLRRQHDAKAVGKGLDGTLYMPRRSVAVDAARRLDEMHMKNGTAFPHDNPSSGMYRLLDAVGGA